MKGAGRGGTVELNEFMNPNQSARCVCNGLWPLQWKHLQFIRSTWALLQGQNLPGSAKPGLRAHS